MSSLGFLCPYSADAWKPFCSTLVFYHSSLGQECLLWREPLLFFIYIKNLSYNSKILYSVLFADDTKVFILDTGIPVLKHFNQDNTLPLNIEKDTFGAVHRAYHSILTIFFIMVCECVSVCMCLFRPTLVWYFYLLINTFNSGFPPENIKMRRVIWPKMFGKCWSTELCSCSHLTKA